jgi:predicted HicB family RNase H-like nuclease
MNETKQERRNLYIREDVYREAKVNAARLGISLTRYITEAISEKNERQVK